MILHRARVLAWLMRDASGFFEWLATRPWYTKIHTDWLDAVPIEPGDRGLEVGCGPGVLTSLAHARGVEMTGLDQSPAMVERARQRAPQCTFIEGDALAIPLHDDEVDVALAASVVNVVRDPQKLVRELARVVRPGGRVSVLFPTPRLTDDAAELIEQQGLVGMSAAALAIWGSRAPKRTPKEIEALIEGAGLLDVRVASFFDDTIASVTGRVSRGAAPTPLPRGG